MIQDQMVRGSNPRIGTIRALVAQTGRRGGFKTRMLSVRLRSSAPQTKQERRQLPSGVSRTRGDEWGNPKIGGCGKGLGCRFRAPVRKSLSDPTAACLPSILALISLRRSTRSPHPTRAFCYSAHRKPTSELLAHVARVGAHRCAFLRYRERIPNVHRSPWVLRGSDVD